jgi:demethylmenaquinone methyltransferase/2-methoxy-6-polyprenyl-1,4-benzoquinol methylase
MITAQSSPPQVDKSGARVREMFGEIAPRYDFLNHLLSMGTDTYWRWRTVRKVPLEGNAPVLDLCTGTGDLALAYWRAGRGQIEVIGADFCHPMLVRGRAKAEHRSDRHFHRWGTPTSEPALPVSFVEADAQQLPFPDDYFQIVSVAFGLRNVSDTARGLAEMTRVCRPGGRVAVLEFSLPGWAPLRAVYGWYFRNVLPKIGQALMRNRAGAYDYLPASVGEFPYGERLADLLRAAGLREVRYYPLTLGIATLYVGRK